MLSIQDILHNIYFDVTKLSIKPLLNINCVPAFISKHKYLY
jgi:hypothetical protein